MISKDALIALGADYEKGMSLCLNNEDFYFKMIGKGLANEKFESLGKNIEAENIQAAFEDAHALKGVCANLALTPLLSAVEKIVEPLRAKDTSVDYKTLYAEMTSELNKFKALF